MRTLNLLIVDDESFIVDWLISLLSTQSDLPLNLYSCYGVAEAKQIIANHRIDILLTDIRMPDGNGLDLAADIRSHWSDCRILVLTAYSEFDYAKRAIDTGINNYILKTEDDNYILGEIRRIIDEFNRTLDERQENISIQRDLERYTMLYRNTLLYHWLKGDFSTSAQYDQCFRDLGLNARHPLYLVVGRIHPDQSSSTPEINALHAKLSGKCMLEESTEIIISEFNGNDVHFLLQPKEEYGQNYQSLLEQQFEIVSNSCHNLYGFRISFVIGSSVINPSDLSEHYWAMNDVLKNVTANSEVFLYQMPDHAVPRRTFRNTASILNQFCDTMERGDEHVLQGELLQIERSLSDETSTSSISYQSAYLAVGIAISDYISRGTVTSSINLSKLYSPTAHANISSAFSYLRNVCSVIFTDERNTLHNSKQRLVDEINQYIERNATHDLSLAELSDHFNYNTDYLSRLYSSMTGSTLKKTITQRRLEYIENLMNDANLSLTDIATQAGFKSRTYFNFFIKHTLGVTPSQYRQSLSEMKTNAHSVE